MCLPPLWVTPSGKSHFKIRTMKCAWDMVAVVSTEKTTAWRRMLLSNLQMLSILTKKELCIAMGDFLVATAARIESLSKADHKERSKAKFRFLLTLLLEEKKRNEGCSSARNSPQSTGANFWSVQWFGNQLMKENVWLTFKELLRCVTACHGSFLPTGHFSANTDFLCGQNFPQVPSKDQKHCPLLPFSRKEGIKNVKTYSSVFFFLFLFFNFLKLLNSVKRGIFWFLLLLAYYRKLLAIKSSPWPSKLYVGLYKAENYLLHWTASSKARVHDSRHKILLARVEALDMFVFILSNVMRIRPHSDFFVVGRG